MGYSFPLAFMANTFAMTCLLIALGLTGNSVMAAEVGIVQGATLALLYAFSANARSLILGKSATVSAYSVAIWRLSLLVPLAILSYWLSVNAAGVGALLAIILIARRCIDWLSEIHLSEMERLGHQDVARRYLWLQSVLMLLVLVWLIGNFPLPLLGLGIWAFTPIFFSIGFIGKSIAAASDAIQGGIFAKVLPHFGSTAIIGITVYVFRLLILLITGKETAGDLYTAFAIGGLTGSVFANALGASIALHEERSGARYFPSLLRHLLNLSLLIGISIFIVSKMHILDLGWTGKTNFFWQATGLSMIGGVIMVYAQRVRFRLLQGDEEHDVFGPDVLMNILIIASVPFAFYLLGRDAMGALYLLSSLFAYVFYISARKEKKENQEALETLSGKGKALRMLIGMLLLLPIFFQLNHGIFNSNASTFDSGGVLRELPIPVSVLVCYGGILLLGTYRKASVSFGFIFLTCVLMMMSVIILTQGQAAEQQAKFILLIQFVLPMVALVLGQVYEPLKANLQDATYAKAFFWILLVTLPIQLFFTWRSELVGVGYLSPSVGFFSVYQHLQYVPVIFVSAYLISLFSLWDRYIYKIILFLFVPFMAIYAAASLSMLAMGLLGGGILVFTLSKIKSERLPLVLLLLTIVFSLGYLHHEKDKPWVAEKFEVLIKFLPNQQVVVDDVNAINDPTIIDHKVVINNKKEVVNDIVENNSETKIEEKNTVIPNVIQRFAYWKYFANQVTSSSRSFFLGIPEPPNRSQYPSAHNYYLDFIYNFGALALLPMLLLISYTVFMVFRNRSKVCKSPSLLGLCVVVLFLLFVDNFLKVGLRQPYPAIFSFFLWGVLLTKLSVITNERDHASF